MGRNPLSGLRYTDEDKKKWAKWYEEGKTVEEICRLSGATRHTVTRWLKEAQVQLRGNPRSYDRKAALGFAAGAIAPALLFSLYLRSTIESGVSSTRTPPCTLPSTVFATYSTYASSTARLGSSIAVRSAPGDRSVSDARFGPTSLPIPSSL